MLIFLVQKKKKPKSKEKKERGYAKCLAYQKQTRRAQA